MAALISDNTLAKFTTFGDLLRFLRRRSGLTQLQLAIAVGYGDPQISRLEQNLRLPDLPTLEARFVPALGLDDEPKAVARLLELAAHVRREDAPAPGLCPYKGLGYFDEADADFFVGRELLTARLVQRILALSSSPDPAEPRFLAIVGASGSGKSSLVRAGLLPALRWSSQTVAWQMHSITPTSRPLENLAAGLTQTGGSLAATAAFIDDLSRDPRSLHLFLRRSTREAHASRFMLVVDQFEEVFALCRSEHERCMFIANLLAASCEASGPALVILTLRADFYASCAAYPELREALARSQEYIGAMSPEELRRVIEEPARRGRWEFEPGLVDLLLREVGHEPGALPLLSHALFETWQRRRGHTLTLGGYSSSGGVRGAIAETAESVFVDQFTPQQHAVARRLFLRLTELGDEAAGGDTRRRASLGELILKPEEAETTRAVLKALSDARLIVMNAGSAEVAHEALIREWPKLRGWLEDNREGLRLHRQLTEAAQEWEALDHDADMLYRGARLAQVREWAASHAEDLNQLEQAFLSCSVDLAEREAIEREAQRQRELQAAHELARLQTNANTRLRRRAYYLVGALVIALAMASIAWLFGQQAVHNAVAAQAANQQSIANAATARAEAEARGTQQAIARANFTHADALRLAAEANRLLNGQSNDANLIALLGLRSMETEYSPEGDAALSGAMRMPFPLRVFTGDMGDIYAAAYSSDGRYIAAAYDDMVVRLWDAQSGQQVRQFTGHTGKIFGIAFSPDGKEIATGSYDATARIWDVDTGRTLKVFNHPAQAGPVAFTPDGKYLVSVAKDLNARLWDLQTGAVVRTFFEPAVIRGLAISPDGRQMLTAGKDAMAHLWDIRSGAEARQFPVGVAIGAADFSPDGQYVVLGGWDGVIRMLDSRTGQLERTFAGNTSEINCIALSPDGRYILAGSVDNAARLWDARTGQQIAVLTGHGTSSWGIGAVHFSPDGQTLFTAGGKIGQFWSLVDVLQPGLATIVRPNDSVYGAVLSPDGRYVALAYGGSQTAILMDLKTGQRVEEFVGHTDYVRTLAFSPDGRLLLTGGGNEDNTVRLWDIATGKELRRVASPEDKRGENVAFSPDGKYVASFSVTGHLWDARSGGKLQDFAGHTDDVYFVRFSPDGRYVLSSSLDGTARLWDIKTGKAVQTLSHPGGVEVLGIAFSPDGKQILTGASDGVMRLWDVATGEELRGFTGHTDAVTSLAFSSDGRYALSGSIDNTARLWEVASGTERRRFVGHTAGVEVVGFSTDGRYVMTGADDGVVRFWFTDYHEEMQYLCDRLPRDLTGDERKQYNIADSDPTCPKKP